MILSTLIRRRLPRIGSSCNLNVSKDKRSHVIFAELHLPLLADVSGLSAIWGINDSFQAGRNNVVLSNNSSRVVFFSLSNSRVVFQRRTLQGGAKYRLTRRKRNLPMVYARYNFTFCRHIEKCVAVFKYRTCSHLRVYATANRHDREVFVLVSCFIALHTCSDTQIWRKGKLNEETTDSEVLEINQNKSQQDNHSSTSWSHI